MSWSLSLSPRESKLNPIAAVRFHIQVSPEETTRSGLEQAGKWMWKTLLSIVKFNTFLSHSRSPSVDFRDWLAEANDINNARVEHRKKMLELINIKVKPTDRVVKPTTTKVYQQRAFLSLSRQPRPSAAALIHNVTYFYYYNVSDYIMSTIMALSLQFSSEFQPFTNVFSGFLSLSWRGGMMKELKGFCSFHTMWVGKLCSDNMDSLSLALLLKQEKVERTITVGKLIFFSLS